MRQYIPIVIFRVYCADHTYCTLRCPLSTSGENIKKQAVDKLNLSMENMLLVELKSNGKLINYLLIYAIFYPLTEYKLVGPRGALFELEHGMRPPVLKSPRI